MFSKILLMPISIQSTNSDKSVKRCGDVLMFVDQVSNPIVVGIFFDKHVKIAPLTF